MSAATLEALLVERAAALEGVELRSAGAGTEVAADGVLVALITPGALEVALRPAIVAAALRTPDVAPSQRGGGWVRFAPVALDDFARDRAVAWLESAVRHVVEAADRP